MFRVLIPLIAISCLFGYDFQPFQEKRTQAQVAHKIKTFLEKDSSIQEYYRLDANTLTIGDFSKGEIDYILYLTQSPTPIPCAPASPLKGAKIALDPGHFGGPYGQLEDRFISQGELQFQEGDLTYQTACILRDLLEAEGAEVLLTREGIGKGAIQKSFFEWLEDNPTVWQKEASLRELFRSGYNQADLVARVDLINAFQPALTICIHYNAHRTEEERKADTFFTQSNFNLAFIPGAFGAKELQTRSARLEFLRLIVTDDLEQSLQLSQAIVPMFTQYLDVPLITADENPSYIMKACLPHTEGVFSRNLALTRRVHGPICYGETLLQNNEAEADRLNEKPCPQRVYQVAKAYFEGIRKYFSDRAL